jgi:hypothetical protein
MLQWLQIARIRSCSQTRSHPQTLPVVTAATSIDNQAISDRDIDISTTPFAHAGLVKHTHGNEAHRVQTEAPAAELYDLWGEKTKQTREIGRVYKQS